MHWQVSEQQQRKVQGRGHSLSSTELQYQYVSHHRRQGWGMGKGEMGRILPDQASVAHEGLVSMLPATDARMFKIAGGNELLPQALLDAARAHLRVGWAVNEVRVLFELCEAQESLCGWQRHHNSGCALAQCPPSIQPEGGDHTAGPCHQVQGVRAACAAGEERRAEAPAWEVAAGAGCPSYVGAAALQHSEQHMYLHLVGSKV